jgi:hypothetical protein
MGHQGHLLQPGDTGQSSAGAGHGVWQGRGHYKLEENKEKIITLHRKLATAEVLLPLPDSGVD